MTVAVSAPPRRFNRLSCQGAREWEAWSVSWPASSSADGGSPLGGAGATGARSGGVRFTSYAYPWIDGEIRDGLLWERKHRRLHVAARWAARSFVAETPDRFDVAWDDEATNSARLARYAMRLVKAMVLGVVEAGDTLDDTAVDVEDRRRAIEIVRGVYAALGEEDRRLYALRYVDRLPMDDVAKGLGVSLSTARRRHDALLDRMAAALLEGGVTEMPPRE